MDEFDALAAFWIGQRGLAIAGRNFGHIAVSRSELNQSPEQLASWVVLDISDRRLQRGSENVIDGVATIRVNGRAG